MRVSNIINKNSNKDYMNNTKQQKDNNTSTKTKTNTTDTTIKEQTNNN